MVAISARHHQTPKRTPPSSQIVELLPTWVVETKAAANRRVIAVMRAAVGRRRAGGPQYQEPGLAWLERQAEVRENLVTERQERGRHND